MKYLVLSIIIAFAFPASAQKKIYLDQRNFATDSSSAKTYAIIFPKVADDSLYRVKHYSLSGQIIVDGTFRDEALTIANGFFKNYKVLSDKFSEYQALDGDGSTKVTRPRPKSYLTEQGHIVNNKKEGAWRVFFLDGTLKRIENYKNGILEKASK